MEFSTGVPQSPYKLPPYARIPGDIRKYTLRTLFEEYRDGGGVCWVDADPPEYSVTSDTGEITCMARIEFTLGLPTKGIYVGPNPKFHDTLESLFSEVMLWVEGAINTGRLWCPPSTVRARRGADNIWFTNSGGANEEVSNALNKVERSSLRPLTISTVHAAMEAEKIANQDIFGGVYPYPRTTVPSAGLFGTSHNNSFIDMSPLEEEKEPNMESRDFTNYMVGYICAPHTSHSYEAGRSRRVAEDVLVRIFNYTTYSSMDKMGSRQVKTSGSRNTWTVFCCGQVCKVNKETVDQLSILHKLSSIGRDAGYGLYIRESERLCVVCVSPGVLTKKCSNGVWADSCNVHVSDITKFSLRPKIDTEGKDFHRACLSGHYSYIPFIEHNAAVRTSISSAQIIQAVCMPYCPATASVSPCHIFKPIVTTPAYKRIMIKQELELDVASYMPGENVCVLYHNLPMNYEDAMIVSKRYVDNGGFSTMSTCRYLLPPSDYVPPVGGLLCGRLSRWWKSRCSMHCKHTKEYVEASIEGPLGRSSPRPYTPFYTPSGVVVSKNTLKTGEQSVKVRSYAQYQSGDKLSTGHGQKGVGAGLVSYEDMPVCRLKDGQQIIPDVVVAVGSIVSRQTVGQVYESGAGIQRLSDPSMSDVVQADEVRSIGEEVSVTDGATGRRYRTALVKDGSPVLEGTLATLGFVRMFNQSQMTREKHFTSHRSMTAHTLRTPVKRSKGGALKEGEMEVQATIAAGLHLCVEELRKRGDTVVVLVCSKCQRLRLLHSCTETTDFIEVTLPYDVVVLDCVNKITYNIVFEYQVEPDV